ncbi:MAG: SsrA-binding protein [Pelagibacteraceae bacterium TMED267]|nr:MAG: SsrA-binding protein [Pelagibacteraceae bacterium TMED267]
MNKKIFFKNRKATFNYEVFDKYTAGIILKGTEIKSIRSSLITMNSSYCIVDNNAIYVKDLNISEYEFGNVNNHEPKRKRKLLLNKREINQIIKKVSDKKLSIIPLNLFVSDRGFAKIQIALCKGKKIYDKRESLKKREVDRTLRQNFKNI